MVERLRMHKWQYARRVLNVHAALAVTWALGWRMLTSSLGAVLLVGLGTLAVAAVTCCFYFLHPESRSDRLACIANIALLSGIAAGLFCCCGLSDFRLRVQAAFAMVIVGTLAVGIGLAVLAPAIEGILGRWRPFVPEGHCKCCGYNLYGLRRSRCPECGTAFAHADSEVLSDRNVQEHSDD